MNDFDVKRDSLYKQFQEVGDALRSVGEKLSQFDFKSIILLAESGGVQRYQALEQQIEALKSKRDKLEEYIANLPFHKAQCFYEQKRDFIELEKALPELKKKIEDFSERIKTLESEIKTAREDLYQINQQEKNLDEIIFHIVQRIKDRKSIKINVDEDIEVDPDFQEMINNILQRQDFLNDMEFLKESLSQIDFSKLQKELDDKETVLDEQASYYGNHIDFVLQKEQTGLSDMEKDLIAQSKRQPGRIHGIHQSIESVINSTNDENAKFHEDIHKCEERAKERLLTAGESAGRNLRSFKQICRRYKDKATFHISTEIAAPEYIDAAIREVRQRVLKWIEAQEFTDKDVIDQIHNDSQFVDEITNELYRGIFKTPSITVSHPDIRRGKRIPFCQSSDKKGQVGNEGLSVGQRVVLELMMLIRMAEYCAGSEDRQITKTFFLIDGMFSSVSKESLLEASLSALKDIRGSFQIIGFLHNIDYVNNPDLFPTELIARPYETFDLNNPDQKSCWVEFEERNQDKNGIGVFEITQGVLN